MITINLANKNDFITEVNLDDEAFFYTFLGTTQSDFGRSLLKMLITMNWSQAL